MIKTLIVRAFSVWSVYELTDSHRTAAAIVWCSLLALIVVMLVICADSTGKD